MQAWGQVTPWIPTLAKLVNPQTGEWSDIPSCFSCLPLAHWLQKRGECAHSYSSVAMEGRGWMELNVCGQAWTAQSFSLSTVAWGASSSKRRAGGGEGQHREPFHVIKEQTTVFLHLLHYSTPSLWVALLVILEKNIIEWHFLEWLGEGLEGHLRTQHWSV